MAQFLFEEQTGQSHQFAIKEQNPTIEPRHWDKHKWKWIGGFILLAAVVGLIWAFWDKLVGTDEENKF
jgi:hypothetical protein